MAGASTFFILIPATYLLFSLALGAIALVDRRLVAARWAALGFAVACFSILVDGYRDPAGDRWTLWLSVATHFLTLLIMLQAFLSRHRLRAPLIAMILTAYGAAFVMPFMPWSPPNMLRGLVVQALCALIIAAGIPAMWKRRRTSLVDLIAFGVVALAALSYFGRSVVMFLNPVGESQADVVAFYEGLNIAFHATSALMGMCVGFVLMMSIGYDLVVGRTREGETDPLTTVGNRRQLDRRKSEDDRGKWPIGAVMVIDLDHFKQVNDLFGHDAGDDVLRAVGERLKQLFPKQGCVCRTGGEEFVVLVEEPYADAIKSLAMAARAAIAELSFEGAMAGTRVTASVGYHVRQPGQEVSDAIRLADQAVYCAKNNGRDRVFGAINANGLNVLKSVA